MISLKSEGLTVFDSKGVPAGCLPACSVNFVKALACWVYDRVGGWKIAGCDDVALYRFLHGAKFCKILCAGFLALKHRIPFPAAINLGRWLYVRESARSGRVNLEISD